MDHVKAIRPTKAAGLFSTQVLCFAEAGLTPWLKLRFGMRGGPNTSSDSVWLFVIVDPSWSSHESRPEDLLPS